MGKIISEQEAYLISGYGTVIDENKCCTYSRIQDFFLQASGYASNQLVDIEDIELNVITFNIDVSMSNRAGNKNWEFLIYNYRGPISDDTIVLQTRCPSYPSGYITLNLTYYDFEFILNNGFISFREYYYYDYYKTDIPAYVVPSHVRTELGSTQVFAKFGEYKYQKDVNTIGKLTFVANSSINAKEVRFWIENPSYKILSHTEYIYINKGRGTKTYENLPPDLYLGNGVDGQAIEYDTTYDLFYEFSDYSEAKRRGQTTFVMREQPVNIVYINE